MFYPLYAIRYMRATRHTLYAIQATSDEFASTSVESALQISSFLTNKANFRDDQMNVCPDITRDYENIANCKLCKNKPNSKPIKPNSKPIKAKTNPIQTQNEPNQTQFQRQKSSWSGNDRIEQSAIPHNSVSNICRLTAMLIRLTMLPNRFGKGLF